MKKWYELVGSNSPTKGVLDDDADVDDLKYVLSSLTYPNLWLFRKAVWKENQQDLLKHVSSAKLVVYKDKELFEKQEAFLQADAAIRAWGCSKNEALWVVVPASQAAVPGITKYPLIYFKLEVRSPINFIVCRE